MEAVMLFDHVIKVEHINTPFAYEIFITANGPVITNWHTAYLILLVNPT